MKTVATILVALSLLGLGCGVESAGPGDTGPGIDQTAPAVTVTAVGPPVMRCVGDTASVVCENVVTGGEQWRWIDQAGEWHGCGDHPACTLGDACQLLYQDAGDVFGTCQP